MKSAGGGGGGGGGGGANNAWHKEQIFDASTVTNTNNCKWSMMAGWEKQILTNSKIDVNTLSGLLVIHSGEIKSLQIMLQKSAKNRKCVIVWVMSRFCILPNWSFGAIWWIKVEKMLLLNNGMYNTRPFPLKKTTIKGNRPRWQMIFFNERGGKRFKRHVWCPLGTARWRYDYLHPFPKL